MEEPPQFCGSKPVIGSVCNIELQEILRGCLEDGEEMI
jgi:hypothetical protein